MSELPRVDIQRSIFHRNFGHKTTFNVGQVIPFALFEAIPGSTHNITTSVVARLQTLLTPMMDNLYCDISWWSVPMRLVMDKWPQFCGENDAGPWTKDKVNYRIPYLLPPPQYVEGEQIPAGYWWQRGSLADYFGIPVDVDIESSIAAGLSTDNYPSALPFRAYAMIINEFWRDQNLQQPIVIHKDTTNRQGSPVRDSYVDGGVEVPWYITDLERGGKPFQAARFHDYFSSCLPQPQRSEPISIFGGFANTNLDTDTPWKMNGPFSPVFTANPWTNASKLDSLSQSDQPYDLYGAVAGTNYTNRDVRYSSVSDHVTLTIDNRNQAKTGFVPTNLWTVLNIPEATIPTLRLAFQLQKYYEKSARGGSRYREYLKEFYGVSNGDSRMQIPEYLGGSRFPLSIHQVANTGKTSGAQLGDLGAMSNTSNVHEDFHMSFSEWSYVIGLVCVRYDNTYSQGLERLWSKRDILQFYNPVFCALGDQPVYKREISLGVDPDPDHLLIPDEVFGYQSSWQEYRQQPSRVSGYMRPEVSGSLASWHLADDYDKAPTLSESWIMCDKTNVDRILAVTSQQSDQIFADFFIQDQCVLPMPLHAIPGLADHF